MASNPLVDAVQRLQDQLHALQVQFAQQLVHEAPQVLLLFAGLLVATVLTARLALGIGRWVARGLR